jgi:hypothetical protein
MTPKMQRLIYTPLHLEWHQTKKGRKTASEHCVSNGLLATVKQAIQKGLTHGQFILRRPKDKFRYLHSHVRLQKSVATHWHCTCVPHHMDTPPPACANTRG